MKTAKALSFEEFKKSVLDDYKAACLSNLLIYLKDYPKFIKDADVNIWDFGLELVHLAISKVIYSSDLCVDELRDAKYILGLGTISKVYQNDTAQLKNLNMTGDEVIFWLQSRVNISVNELIALIKSSHSLKIPIAITIIEDADELLSSDFHITNQYINKILKETELFENIYQCETNNYPGLCKIYEEGIAKCRKDKLPVLFHLKLFTQTGTGKFSMAVEKLREWVLQTGVATCEEIKQMEEQVEQKAAVIKTQAAKECLRLSNKLL
ncbi:MAG: hypothetical protein HY738_12015 [Bacteroidia bacterium]|nr:hypothetical protein [Bacteroidia bacterium]